MYFHQWRDQLINQLFPLKYLARRWKPSLNSIKPQEATLESFVQETPSLPVEIPDIYESHLPAMHYETFPEVRPEIPAFAEPMHAAPVQPMAVLGPQGPIDSITGTNTVPGLEELIQLESPEIQPGNEVPSDFF